MGLLRSTAQQKLKQAKSLTGQKSWNSSIIPKQAMDKCRWEGILTVPAHGGATFQIATQSQKLSPVLEVSELVALQILCGALVHDGVHPCSIEAKDIPAWNVEFQVASGLPWHIAVTGWSHHFEGKSAAIVGSITIRTSLKDDGVYLLL